MVAPFWTDLNLGCGGEVYYRAITDANDSSLLRASDEAASLMTLVQWPYQLEYLVVVTFDGVHEFGSTCAASSTKRASWCWCWCWWWRAC